MTAESEELSLSEAVIDLLEECRFHRPMGPRRATERFFTIGSNFLLVAMIQLMIGISLDFHLIARMFLDAPALSAGLAAGLGALFCFLWLVYPRISRSRDGRSGRW